MGPYCKFCGNRCFVHMPEGTPEHILKAYGIYSIVATCQKGQEFERQKVGYCYNDIMREIRAAEHTLERKAGSRAKVAVESGDDETIWGADDLGCV